MKIIGNRCLAPAPHLLGVLRSRNVPADRMTTALVRTWNTMSTNDPPLSDSESESPLRQMSPGPG